MFALREITVSLTCFVLLYCLLSALVVIVWRPLKLLHVAQQSVTALLFALRILPLLASALITLVLVVPSFLRLEPGSTTEDLGAMPLLLGLCALLLIGYGCVQVIAAEISSTRVVARWLEGARPLRADAGSVLTFQSRRET